MENKIKKLRDQSFELEVNLNSEEVEKYFISAYKDIQKNAEIPGFRKGKAPMDLLKKKYQSLAKEKVVDFVLPESYKNAVKEHNIDPVAEPVVKEINFTKDNKLCFKINIPVRPEIKLSKYKGIKIVKNKIKIEDKEIEEAIKRMQHQKSHIEQKNRPSKENDYVECNLTCFLEGKAIEDKKNISIPLKKEFPIPEIYEKLKGAEQGQKHIIKAVLPKEIYDEKYAGKSAEFHVEVTKIKEQIFPEVNDEFAAQNGSCKNLKELKDKIKEDIVNYKKTIEEERLENELFNNLLKYNKFNVPQGLVDKQKNILLENSRKNLEARGFDEKQIKSYLAKTEKEIDEQAQKRVKLYFLLDEIAKVEDIKIKQQDIEKEVEKIADSSGQDLDKVKESIAERNLLPGLFSQLQNKKIIDFLMDNSKITEK